MAFALSNTPTRFLHQLFANHKDSVTHSEPSKTPQLNIAGIDCHCESNVVISPYTFQSTELPLSVLSCYHPIEIPKVNTIAFVNSITVGLRGPPIL